jgi:Protein tyrosine and serine/threonine kinase
LRPTIPKNVNPKLAALIEQCWQQDPTKRPDFAEILEILQHLSKEVLAFGLILFFSHIFIYWDLIWF